MNPTIVRDQKGNQVGFWKRLDDAYIVCHNFELNLTEYRHTKEDAIWFALTGD